MTDNRPYQSGEIGELLAIGIGSRDGNILCERRGVYARGIGSTPIEQAVGPGQNSFVLALDGDTVRFVE